MKNITTGVDKLLQILSVKKKTTAESISIELGLDKETIMDWLELLETEGLVTLTTKLSKTWVEAKQITEKKAEKAGGEAISQKEAFIRKIDTAIKSLDKDTAGFEQIKNQFYEIQKHVKNELETVRTEMKELENFDKLKQTIGKKIQEQKTNYETFIKTYEDQIEEYNKQELKIINKIKEEEKKANELEEKMLKLKEQKEESEKTVKKGLEELQKISKQIETDLGELNKTQKRITEMKNDIKEFNIQIQKNKQKQLQKLGEKLHINKTQIENEHEELLRKAQLTVSELKTYASTEKTLYKNFETLFGKKIKIHEKITEIEKEREDLKKELEKLEEKAKKFDILKRAPEIKNQIKNIEETLKKYENKRKGMIDKIIELTNMIKG